MLTEAAFTGLLKNVSVHKALARLHIGYPWIAGLYKFPHRHFEIIVVTSY